MRGRSALGAVIALCVTTALASAIGQSGGQLIEAPRFWNDHGLSEWATSLAGLNVRPSHYSENEYYSAPVGELVRTYAVYFSGREPRRAVPGHAFGLTLNAEEKAALIAFLKTL